MYICIAVCCIAICTPYIQTYTIIRSYNVYMVYSTYIVVYV